MVATTFSADTPNLVTDIVRRQGVAGNWCWWAFTLTGVATVFFYARLWRRSAVLTDLEFYEIRYSGNAASAVRGFRAIYLGGLNAVRIRHHGDYHLGNILYTGRDFLIIDFEGEPIVPLSERRLKHSPLRDVAGMIRSFHYAAHAALEKQFKHGTLQPEQQHGMEKWAAFWSWWVSVIFYNAYLKAAGTAIFLPAKQADLELLLDTYILRKAIYELGCELSDRPEWVKIPLQGLLELLGADPAYSPAPTAG